jgi:hypothetical protein
MAAKAIDKIQDGIPFEVKKKKNAQHPISE